MSRFGAGNLHTLLDMPKAADPPVDVRAELLKFHKKQYGASRMRLAVIGMEPLADLERWVRASFSAIPDIDARAHEPEKGEQGAGQGDGQGREADGGPGGGCEEEAPVTAGEGGALQAVVGEEAERGGVQGGARRREWIASTPFDAAWKRAFFILPVAERRQLSLFFPAPPTQSEFREKPAHFLSYLVGHEGPGSLLAAMKALGWATELSAGVSH